MDVFMIIVLIFSIILHEVAHGYVADRLGDPTARYQGRLTLNPLPHIDPMGSIVLPLLLIVSNSPFLFGWAKPVPYNPYNLKDPRHGEAKVAMAGSAVNLTLALIFGLLIRTLSDGAGNVEILSMFASIVLINLVLGIFNLVPIPPLDGSKILFNYLPLHLQKWRGMLEQNGFWLLLIFIFFGFELILPIIYFLFEVFTGLGLR